MADTNTEAAGTESAGEALAHTPLHTLHAERGAKFAAFAGYDMPIQYPDGIMAEHLWTRTHAGLFDVSHMGPCFLDLNDKPADGQAAHEAVAAILERLCPSDIRGLKPGQVRYTLLLSPEGGILDDLMVARPADPAWQGVLHIVVNAGTKTQDFDLIARAAGDAATLRVADGCGLIALQGPEAAAVMAGVIGDSALPQTFMNLAHLSDTAFGPLWLTRSGYTGEDGFEVLVQGPHVVAFTETLLADSRVKLIGLGARDSLRLEAGLCLYGHDLDPGRTPVQADLKWTLQKRRREAADFPGAARILGELASGPAQVRVGIKPLGRQPAREGVEVQSPEGAPLGVVTSGGFGPSVQGPVAMGYVAATHAAPGTRLHLIVRGKALEAEVVDLPFVAHRYKR